MILPFEASSCFGLIITVLSQPLKSRKCALSILRRSPSGRERPASPPCGPRRACGLFDNVLDVADWSCLSNPGARIFSSKRASRCWCLPKSCGYKVPLRSSKRGQPERTEIALVGFPGTAVAAVSRTWFGG